jgi:hypothetical protein
MASDVEVYKQKYENFRHFDRLRWQMPGIAFAISAGVIALSVRPGVPLTLVTLLLLLMACGVGVCAFAMSRIRARLEENRTALIEVAVRVGDYRVARPGTASATFVLERFLWVVVTLSALVACGVIATMWGFRWV